MSARASHVVRLFAVLSALGAGCAEPDSDDLAQDEQEAPEVLAQASGVSANGTGCRAGTWSASGNALSGNLKLTFQDYEVVTVAGKPSSVDCTINMPAQPSGNSRVAVKSFTFVGSAQIPAERRAKLSGRAWPQGVPANAASIDEPLAPGLRGAFSRVKSIPEDQLVWSACTSSARRLNLATRAFFDSSPSSAAGYITVTAIKDIKVLYRPC